MSPRSDRRRDARQPAGPAGTAAGTDRGGAGRRVRPPGQGSASGSIEESFRRRAAALPDDARSLLLLAAANPTGDPVLVWQAGSQRGIGPTAAWPAAEVGLIEFGAQVRFRHPLVRSAVYRSASVQERHDAHRTLAEATDPDLDPDRRIWHRVQATWGPDEDVAAELERSAGRAQARGGLAAAAAFLERAVALTPDPARLTYLDALSAASFAGSSADEAGAGVTTVARAVLAAPRPSQRPSPLDLLLTVPALLNATSSRPKWLTICLTTSAAPLMSVASALHGDEYLQHPPLSGDSTIAIAISDSGYQYVRCPPLSGCTASTWQLCDAGAHQEVDLAGHFAFVDLRRGRWLAPMRPETVYDKVASLKRGLVGVVPARWTPHWFRHAHASALLSGAREHVMMRTLGHVDIQTALNLYDSVTEGAELESCSELTSRARLAAITGQIRWPTAGTTRDRLRVVPGVPLTNELTPSPGGQRRLVRPLRSGAGAGRASRRRAAVPRPVPSCRARRARAGRAC